MVGWLQMLTDSNSHHGRIEDKTLAVAARLDQLYGPRPWRSHGPPLDELVATILSQHTSDTNTARAFASLSSTFKDWDEVRTAPVDRVEHAIRVGGLAAIKARRIKGILNDVFAEHGQTNIDHLQQMPLDQAHRWLVALHGVGPKIAACVLLFSLGKPALPVDTHVHRVARRIGLIGAKVSADAAHAILETSLGADRDRIYAFHMNTIAHGRMICKARLPRCEQCDLVDLCDYAQARLSDD
jgi:endonuclease-3